MKVKQQVTITSFPTSTEDMSRISEPGTRTSYTSMRRFQNAIQKNAMTIKAPETMIGHLGLFLPEIEYKIINIEHMERPQETVKRTKNTNWRQQIGPIQISRSHTSMTGNKWHIYHVCTHTWSIQTTYHCHRGRPAHQCKRSIHHWIHTSIPSQTPKASLG